MNTLSLFNFNGHDVRVVMIDGAPWWVAADVCRALGMDISSGTNRWLVTLGADEKRLVPKATSSSSAVSLPNRGATCVSESGLYKFVLRSDKPEARAFQNWVTREVLPAIRKDGSYVMGEEKVRTGEMSEDELIIAAMGALQRKVERVTAERDAAQEVIRVELEQVTGDEFRSLNHQYWTKEMKSRVSGLASRIMRDRGIPMEKQTRLLVEGPGAGRYVQVNVYPRFILAEVCAKLGIDAK